MNAAVLSPTKIASTDTVRFFLRADGVPALALAVAAYHYFGFSWWLFAATILLPDLGMIGYLKDPRVGALTYNAIHTYLAPFALGLIGWLLDAPLAMALATVWAAHIGIDRMLGYGLKRSTGFKDTHLSPVA